MTKLEELTALLVNELHQFNANIQKLEKLNSEMTATKLKIDVSEYKSIIETHQNQMHKHQSVIKQFEINFNAKIKQAKIYPTWAVVIFVSSILVSLISLFVLFSH